MLPSRRPSSSEICRIQAAARPVATAVTSTPQVASRTAGFQTARMAASDVLNPPSNRIIASASVPIAWASR